jgi:hypothetical protein
MAKGTKMRYHLGYGMGGYYFLCTEGSVEYEMVQGPPMEDSEDVISVLRELHTLSVGIESGGDESFNKEWRWSVPKEFL